MFLLKRGFRWRNNISESNVKMSTPESVAFETNLRKTNQILRITGIQIDDEETNQTMMQRLWNRRLYCILIIILVGELLGEVAWLVLKGINFVELTYIAPCVMLSSLGTAKSYYRIKYGHHINDLIHSLNKLQTVQFNSELHKDLSAYIHIQKMIGDFERGFKIVFSVNTSALITFYVSPLAIMAYGYHVTGEVEYRYPFLILYPFNTDNPRVYPFVYVHQMMGGVIAVFTVFGPDCLYYIFCTFIQVQFRSLRYDYERIITPNPSLRHQEANATFRKKLKVCVTHHMELIRCCDLIEIMYSMSALFNFMTSSLLLCLAGFNIMAHEDMVVLTNFLSFLFMCLLQIYLICDYGDKVSQASMDLSNAVYNSQWYMADAKTAKDLLIILTRAQKPCKLTAYRFTQINLGAFMRTLSTSWSYFALLQSVYSRGQ